MNALPEVFLDLEAANRALPGGGRGFFDGAEFPWARDVEAAWKPIRAEIDALLGRVEALPNFQDLQADQKEITRDDGWKVFPFYAYGSPYAPNLRRCPRTVAALAQIPGMTSAMFSILRGPKTIPPHRGPFNGVLRYHLALHVPGEPSKCRIRVGSEWRCWKEGKSLIFDDTLEHEVVNELSGPRVVLFVDFLRPAPPALTRRNGEMVRAIRRSPSIRSLLHNLDRWNVEFDIPVSASPG